MDLLAGTVQGYAWGDRTAIATMQGRSPDGEPEAELWFGAHPVAPSQLQGDGTTLLDAVVARPDALLGAGVADRFGGFPYLLKILAAAEPLSIQAHPSPKAAAVGFARENAAGIALDASTRTYRDDNHKPELICALTAFEAKCGFRAPEATVATIDALLRAEHRHRPRPSGDAAGTDRGRELLHELRRRLQADADPAAAIGDALAWLFRLSSADAETMVGLVVEAASSCDPPTASEIRWIPELHRGHPYDIGIVVSLLLNHVILQPGEAMFLPAGNLHAYLEGVGVELMANSDNVVRGGLTEKHIDVDELLTIVDPRPAPAPIQRPSSRIHTYRSPVDEFALTRLAGSANEPTTCRFEPSGPEIMLVTAGHAELRPVGGVTATAPGPEGFRVNQGTAALVEAADGPYEVTLGAEAIAWRASVGGPTGGQGHGHGPGAG